MDHQLLVGTLKKALKLKGITYQKLAKLLDISETTVGRIFSEGTFTLERFLKILEVIGIPLQELLSMQEIEMEGRSQTLTLEQEKFFVKNLNYLAFAILLIKFEKPQKVADAYNLSKETMYKILGQLEKLGLINWLPGDEVRILVSRRTMFLKDGPLSTLLDRQEIAAFVDNDFKGPNEFEYFSIFYLSERAQKILHAKMEELSKEIGKEMDLEALLKVPSEQVGIYMAIRPFEDPFIENLRGLKA
jgi:transcriptional regulator with XRE-family HTH domain